MNLMYRIRQFATSSAHTAQRLSSERARDNAAPANMLARRRSVSKWALKSPSVDMAGDVPSFDDKVREPWAGLTMDTNENPVATGTEAAGADGGGENMEPAPRSNTFVLVPSRKRAGGSCNFRLGSNPTHEGSIKMDQAENVYSTPPISTTADNPQGTCPAAARQQKLVAQLRKRAFDEIDRLLALASAAPPPR